MSVPRARGFLLSPRPVCSACLRFLGDLSGALEKPWVTGFCLQNQERLSENTHYKQSSSTFIFLHLGVHTSF